jgi:hypothetical protein
LANRALGRRALSPVAIRLADAGSCKIKLPGNGCKIKLPGNVGDHRGSEKLRKACRSHLRSYCPVAARTRAVGMGDHDKWRGSASVAELGRMRRWRGARVARVHSITSLMLNVAL